MPWRIQLVLVAEAHRLQRQNRFAGLIHGLDVVLETPRGGQRAELTVGIDINRHAPCHGGPGDASHEGIGLNSRRADADGVAFASVAWVEDVDIVTARSEVIASAEA
jgi:hypothetical protein